MNSVDMIDNCLADKEQRTITVGLLEKGIPQYIVFGGGGAIIAPVEYEYELCEVTNVFTGALVQEQILQNNLSLLSPCSAFLGEMPKGYDFTVKQLLTHTSGLSQNILTTAQKIYSRLRPYGNTTLKVNFQNIKEHIKTYKLSEMNDYCNCGANYALLGEILAACCKQSYTDLVLNYTHRQLRLLNTRVGNGKGNLSSCYHQRNADDSFIAADGLVSNVSDVLKLLQKMLEKPAALKLCTEIISNIATPNGFAIGSGWFISNDGIAWQSGNNAGFNCFVGVDYKFSRAVTVLSNCAATAYQSAAEAGLKYLHEKRENNEFVFI